MGLSSARGLSRGLISRRLRGPVLYSRWKTEQFLANIFNFPVSLALFPTLRSNLVSECHSIKYFQQIGLPRSIPPRLSPHDLQTAIN